MLFLLRNLSKIKGYIVEYWRIYLELKLSICRFNLIIVSQTFNWKITQEGELSGIF